jgi:hypothetical protein
MSRPYLSSQRLARLIDRLSERDMAILETLERVRLASASQLGRLHFPTATAQVRRRALLRVHA